MTTQAITVYAEDLPKWTEMREDNEFFSSHDVKQCLEDRDNERWENWVYYVCDLEPINKPNVMNWFIDSICEDMEDKCCDWSEKRIDDIKELESKVWKVLNEWRDNLGEIQKTVYARKRLVIKKNN